MTLNQYSVYEVKADVRMDTWIWLYRRKILNGQNPCVFSLDLGSTLGQAMPYTDYFQIRNFDSLHYLLPSTSLDWLTKDMRQIKWALDYVECNLRCDIKECPAQLEGRNRVVASLDFWECPIANKVIAVKAMESAWYEVLREDEVFKWMKTQNASSFEFIWGWLTKKGRANDFNGPPISSYKDLLKFYDEIGANVLQKKLDSKEIRGALNSRNNLNKMKTEGKSQLNVRIRAESIAKIEELGIKLRLNRAETVEWLVNRLSGEELLSKKY